MFSPETISILISLSGMATTVAFLTMNAHRPAAYFSFYQFQEAA